MAEHRAAPIKLVERWRAAEPVRLALYPVVVPLVAWLVYRGVILGAEAPLILAVVAAVLGVAGTETARAGAYSPRTFHENDRAAYAEGVRDALGRTPDQIADQRGGAAGH